jgi:hypothetical protein
LEVEDHSPRDRSEGVVGRTEWVDSLAAQVNAAKATTRHGKKRRAVAQETIAQVTGYMALISELNRVDLNAKFLGKDGKSCGLLRDALADTGSQVNLLPITVARQMEEAGTTLQRTENGIKILGASGEPLENHGIVYAEVELEGNEARLPFVVSNVEKPILNRDACRALRVFNVKTGEKINLKSEEAIFKHFEDIFDDKSRPLPPMRCKPMSVKLKEGAVPHAVYKYRPVPYGLRKKVKAELDSMVARGVARKMDDEPSEWLSCLHYVTKKNGDIRIVNDMRKLNESIQRPHYPMTTSKEALAGIEPGSEWFSVLDMSSGFWQVPLEEGAQLYTCFITPWGR